MRCAVLFLVCVLLAGHAARGSDLSLTMERIIEITSQVVHEETYYEVENTAESKLNAFNILVENEHLADVQVYKVTDKKTSNNEIVESLSAIEHELVAVEDHHGKSYNVYEVTLASPLSKNGRAMVKTVASFTHVLSAKPEKMSQTDVQKMMFRGSHFIASAYESSRQTTEIRCMQVISHSENQPPSRVNGENQIVSFGPYQNVEAYAHSPSYVHLYNTAPFLVVDQLVREIEISHWGNIAVEESYHLHNDGTALKGSFSRLDYMMGQMGNSIPHFTQYLPEHAFDVYYRDIIGNISTSNVYKHQDFVKLEVTPRFVLMGGWKDEFKTGYNLPTYSHLTYSSEGYELSIPMINLYESAIIDDLEVRVILPEGASDIEISSEFVSIENIEQINRKTYLDTYGRPVITFKAKNLIDVHDNRNLVVKYQFSTSTMIREPLFLITGFACFFMLAIVYFRTDLSFGTEENVFSDADNKLIKEYISIVDKRSSLFTPPAGKNIAKQLAKFNNDVNESFAAAKSILAKLNTSNPEACSVCREAENASKDQVIAFRSLQSLQNATSQQGKSRVGDLKAQFATAKTTVQDSLEQLRK